MNPRIRVAGVLLDDEQKVLFIEHQKNGEAYWLLPGGGVDYGENINEALIREFSEETGLVVQVKEFLFVVESIAPDSSRHIVNLIFLVDKVGGKLTIGVEDRLKSLKYLQKTHLCDMIIYPNIKKELIKYLTTGKITQNYLGSRWD
ncbi:MAG: NUDIX hydrolase [Fusobacteria bacterium]|nr:NUDIX hydrolase [Fusobacteriota bacterium]